ncbi:MAG: hypothetical protein Q8O67_01745 [Deltaproteobacteria bacterium]|nr:hypothetical protein [Deltaproteobacteria bacterium]
MPPAWRDAVAAALVAFEPAVPLAEVRSRLATPGTVLYARCDPERAEQLAAIFRSHDVEPSFADPVERFEAARAWLPDVVAVAVLLAGIGSWVLWRDRPRPRPLGPTVNAAVPVAVARAPVGPAAVDWRANDVVDDVFAFASAPRLFELRVRGSAVDHVWKTSHGISGSSCRLFAWHATPTAFSEQYVNIECTTPVLRCGDARVWFEAVADARRRHTGVPLHQAAVNGGKAVLFTTDGTVAPKTNAAWSDEGLCTGTAIFWRNTNLGPPQPWPVD